jgi:hypothetical protein
MCHEKSKGLLFLGGLSASKISYEMKCSATDYLGKMLHDSILEIKQKQHGKKL